MLASMLGKLLSENFEKHHEAERIPYFLRMPTASLKNNHVLIPIVSHLPLR